jgi:hypothetical protein
MFIPTRFWKLTSYLISLLSIISSLFGLLHPLPYINETANWALQARGQDLGNLLAALLLAYSVANLHKYSLKHYFLWIGSLMYFVYAYLVYALAVHFNFLFLLYVLILSLSLHSLIAGLVLYRPHNVPIIKDSFSAVVLLLTGSLFALLWLSEIIPSIINNTTPQGLIDTALWVNPIHVIDLSVVLPGFIYTGYQLLLHSPFAAIMAPCWLVFSTLMGSSIVFAMILMAQNNFPNTFPPMIMTSIIVLFCIYSLTRIFQKAR